MLSTFACARWPSVCSLEKCLFRSFAHFSTGLLLLFFSCIRCLPIFLQSYYQSREHKDIMVDIFRQVNPDLIFIQKPNDYMCDHVAASHLAFDASFMATCPHYETKYPAIDKIAPIYYMGTASEVGFNPTEYVDITDVYETKIKMLMCHESQEVWLREHDNVDYTNECRILSEFRGMQCKVKYAEAFEPCLVAHRIVPYRMLP